MKPRQTPRQTGWQTSPVCQWFRQTISTQSPEGDFNGMPPVCRGLPASADLLRQTIRIASAAVLPPLGGNGRRQTHQRHAEERGGSR